MLHLYPNFGLSSRNPLFEDIFNIVWCVHVIDSSDRKLVNLVSTVVCSYGHSLSHSYRTSQRLRAALFLICCSQVCSLFLLEGMEADLKMIRCKRAYCTHIHTHTNTQYAPWPVRATVTCYHPAARCNPLKSIRHIFTVCPPLSLHYPPLFMQLSGFKKTDCAYPVGSCKKRWIH